MWELSRVLPLGRISRRTHFLFAAVLLLASFLVGLFPNTAYAADASWQNSKLVYGGKEYVRVGTAQGNESHGLPEGTTIFAYTEPAVSGASNPTQKAHLIYFASGTDPTTATTASYQTFDFTPPNTFIKTGSSPASITIDPSGAVSTTATESDCKVDNGIGWIVCPVTNALADAMDFIYGVISSFLEVRPLQTTQDATLYKAWSYMRNFANIAFVIAFLIVIYSQVTGVGVSAYGIRKVLPRIVIAAILVNVSYWLCAIAVDLSNIFGASFQNIFSELRTGLSNNPNWNMQISWQEITAAVLSGFGGGLLGGYLLLSGTTIGGAVWMLIPVLLTVVLAALVALVILALRQGLIVILIVISPLAAVAYLLPNTESYAKKWGNLFQTMLVLFPIFSIIFGGSQLAGLLIIQNANNIVMVILGMAVQVAPLFVTPLIVKFSGTLLGRIAGMINNPNKGLIDRTRNWAKDRADVHRAKVQARPLDGRFGAARRMFGAAGRENARRKREWQKKNYTTTAEGNWLGTDVARGLREAEEYANNEKARMETFAERSVTRMKTTNGHRLQVADVNLRLEKLELDLAKTQGDVQFDNLRAETTQFNPLPPGALGQAALRAQSLTQESMVAARQLHTAQEEHRQDFAKALIRDDTLRQRAGGISEYGADSALAAAISADRKAYGQSVDEARQVTRHFNLSSEQRQELALGNAVRAVDSKNNVRVFTAQDIFAREAVIEDQIKTGTVEQAEQLIGLSGGALSQFKTTISSAVAEANLGAKTIYLGGSTINEIAKGTINSPDKLLGVAMDTLGKGKISARKLVDLDKDAVSTFLKAAQAIKSGNTQYATLTPAELSQGLQELKTTVAEAKADRTIRSGIAKNVAPLFDQIERL